MARRLAEVPDPSDEYQRYIKLNPAADLDSKDTHPGITEEIEEASLVQGGPNRGEFREHNEICRKIRLWQISTRHRIQQMEENPLWAAKGSKGADVKEFRKAQRTFVKTMQEVFCRPEDRMVFDREEDLSTAIAHIIIDPRRISNTVLENLGLTEFILEKGLSQEEQLECRAAAIPAIKQMLRNLEPIRLPSESDQDDNKRRYFRLMRITEGPNEGYLIGTQHIDRKKRLFKIDLPSAERRLLHIEKSYDEEIEKLEFIELTLKRVQEALRSNWPILKQKEEELDALKRALQEAVDLLEHSSNRTKRRLKDQIAKCTSLRDSRGRYNPQAMSLALRKALYYIDNRHRSIERIWRFVGQDKAKLAQLRHSQDIPVNEFLSQMDELHDQFRLFRNELNLTELEQGMIEEALGDLASNYEAAFRENPELGAGVADLVREARSAVDRQDTATLMQAYGQLLSIPWPSLPSDAKVYFRSLRDAAPNPIYVSVAEPHKSKVIGNLDQRQKELKKVKYQPMLSFARVIDQKLESTKQAVTADDSNKAAHEFVSVYITAKLYRAYSAISKLQHKVSVSPKDQDPRVLLEELDAIYAQLSQRIVAPTIVTQEFNDAFKHYYQLLDDLKERLQRLMKISDATEEPEEQDPDEPEESKVDSKRGLEDILQDLVDRAPTLLGFRKRAKSVLQMVAGVRKKVDRVTTAVTRAWAADKAEEKMKRQAPVASNKKPYIEAEKARTYRKMKERIAETDFAAIFDQISSSEKASQ